MHAARFQAIYARLLDAYGPQGWWPGETPFEVMVGAVLTQNTAWSNVERAIDRLRAAGALNPASILALPDAELAECIRPAGYYNVKARRLKALCDFLHAAAVLDAPERLRALAPLSQLRRRLLLVHGIGEETADSILLYALELPVFVIDAYTRRLFSRLGEISGTESYAELQAGFERTLPADHRLFNEYHALIVRHAKEACRARPLCAHCPLRESCANPAR